MIAIFIRLICLYLFRNVSNYDLESYFKVGELTLKRVNIYPEISNLHHPYLPFFLYFEALAVWLGKSKIISVMIIKSINILFDLGILYLVYLLSNKNLQKTFIYAINPVTILITTLHGQFDVIPIFFILLSIYWINIKKEALSVFSFSFAILTKTWPVLFIIPILRKVCVCHPRENGDPERLDSRLCLRRQVRGNDRWGLLTILIMFFPVLFTTLYCVFFKVNPIDIGKTIIYYQGLWGIWGPWSWIGKIRIIFQKAATILFLISFLGYSLINTTKSIVKNIYLLLIFFFIFTTNFSIQYFAWFIPFLIIILPKKYLHLVTLIALYIFSFYFNWLFCTQCKSTPHWLVLVQNIIGFILWLSFIKVGYLSRKIS